MVMWEVFEHFKFIKHLFNFGTDKCWECSFYGIMTNLFIVMIGNFNYFATNILGISAFFLVSIFVIMIIDAITGLAASKKENQKRTSKKGARWFVKFGSYMAFLYFINSLIREFETLGIDWLEVFCGVIRMYILFHVMYWELFSIGENLERLGYDARIFKLITNLFSIFKKTVKKKTDIDLEDDKDK